MAQRSKFIGAPSRNEFWVPQEYGGPLAVEGVFHTSDIFFQHIKNLHFRFHATIFACFYNIYFDLCCLTFYFQKKLKNFSKINIKYQVKIQILKSVNFELFLNYPLTSHKTCDIISVNKGNCFPCLIHERRTLQWISSHS